ncbi:MAG: hypothetical protein LCH95_13930 [Proteobacteria bacterium]|nr:hypothetical protein [Pseudomonadota bacterium]
MPQSIDPRIELLPGAMRPVAELSSFEDVVCLLEAFGGTRLYVSHQTPMVDVRRRCGERLVEALRANFAGDYVTLPRARRLQAELRRVAIRADRRPANQIAREYGISVDSVYRIRGGRPPRPLLGADGAPGLLSAKATRRAETGVIDLEELIDRLTERR